MRRILIAAVFVGLLLAACERAVESQSGSVRQLAPGVFSRQGNRDRRQPANTSWVVFRDYVVVIDANTPWGLREILPEIKKTTNKPIRFVFDTHYHADHAFGNSIFVDEGAAIVCSEDCFAESKAKNPAQWKPELPTDRLEHPQVSFQDRMVFDDGNQRVELLKMGPGHTLGDAVAWLPQHRILFTGDLCVNRPGNNVADKDADPDGWVRGLDRMLLLDVAILIPGHGVQGTKDAIGGQRAYLADMIRQVRDGIRRGATPDQLEKQVDLSAHKPWGQDEVRNKTSVRAVYAKLSR